MLKRVSYYTAIAIILLTCACYAGYEINGGLKEKKLAFPLEGRHSAHNAAFPGYRQVGKFTMLNNGGSAGVAVDSEQVGAYYRFGTSAQAAALIEGVTGQMLYVKNSHVRLPMASTAKILTAITVINIVDDLSATVKVPPEAAGVEGSSIYLKAGESISYSDLLYGLMLQSGNDAAATLAYAVGGSIKGFAELMNKQAKAYGATNSNFTNPHGLHQKDNYTTAHDLARITAGAMRNPTFKKIVSSKSAEIFGKESERTRRIHNKNKLLTRMNLADGVKTGFTKNAGRCFVGSAAYGGMQFVCVVLNCGPMFEETQAILENAVSQYVLANIVYKNMVFGQIRVVNRADKKAVVVSGDEFSHVVSKYEKEGYEIRRSFTALSAPLKKGAEAGKYEVFFKNELIFTGKLIIIEDVE